jgi:hypothetical protein
MVQDRYVTIAALSPVVNARTRRCWPVFDLTWLRNPIGLRWDVRIAPKYHRTRLSGGDSKALTKKLGKARAMAGILAAQSAEP